MSAITHIASSVRFLAGQQAHVVSVSGNLSLTSEHHIVLVNATAGPVTITLPDATTVQAGYRIKKTDATSNAVTVATVSSQTIDGASTMTIATQYATGDIASDGANWFDLSIPISGVVTANVFGEVPAGAINGSNATFTTSRAFASGLTRLHVNGLRQKIGDDYTETTSTTLTLAVAPQAGDTLLVDYRPL